MYVAIKVIYAQCRIRTWKRKQPLIALCIDFIFLKVTDINKTDETEHYHRKSYGGSVAASSSKTTIRHQEEELSATAAFASFFRVTLS